MDHDHLDNSAPHGQDGDNAGDDAALAQRELEAFREVLPFMFDHFPEIRKVRPEQFNANNPVRGVLEEFIEQRRRQTEGVLENPDGNQAP